MLRITAGQFKGKHLELPIKNFTRPSSERLRQAVFNILANHIDFNGIMVLDAFAGSGALGLEALSRGATHAIFCENNPQVQKVLRKNILETLKTRTDIMSLYPDIFELKNNFKFNLVFLDPPYDKSLEIKAIEHLMKYDLLNKNAIIVIEQRKNSIPITFEQFTTISLRIYGNCQVQFLINNN